MGKTDLLAKKIRTPNMEKKCSMMRRISLFLLAILSWPAFSQSPYRCSQAALAEKIYLQLGSKIYTTNETIWFKAIVANADDHVPTKRSGVLYVELIGPNKSIIEKKLVKIEKGIGDGFFQLNQNYAQGSYQIRAYTEWNKNFGEDFIFKEYIQVFAPVKKEKVSPITNVTLVENPEKERRINATFDPCAIDSLHKKELTLFLTFDTKKDTLTIKRNEKKYYFLDYAIPDSCQFVTLQIQTENHFTSSKTIVLNKEYLDLQFFPESGELVQGIQSLVGFKGLDCNGKGKMVEGEIVNGRGEFITSFKSNQLGMGTFMLTPVDTTEKYVARILPQSNDHPQEMYHLPHVVAKGNVLSVRKKGDGVQISASSNYLKHDSIYLSVSSRGIVYYIIKGLLKDGRLEYTLPDNKLPEGIVAFTMKNNRSVPVAERLYFNERPESRIHIAVSADKNSYMQREPTKLNIEALNNAGYPENANLSVLVLNEEQMGPLQDTRQNILSYFLLSSDLKGEIENPGFYFKKEENRFYDLDALLLTQGWSKYNYTKPADKIQFYPETSLNVTGTVSGAIFSKKKKKEIELTMMTFGHNPSAQTQNTDSMGRFSFHVNDEYGQNLNVLIQSANKSGVKKDYTITLDKRESPAISFNPIKSIESADSVVQMLVEKNMERKKIDDSFLFSKGDIQLKEVVVQGYRMTPERKMVAEKYGKPKVVIEGKTIEEKEEKWSYGLYSVLLFNFPDKVMIINGMDGNLYAKVTNGNMTLVVIDGIPVKDYDYPYIANIPPSEVKSFEIIEGAKNFIDLFVETFTGASPADAPNEGDVDVIAIYTYSGQGLFGTNKSKGLLKAAVPVFSASREFYSPKYKNLKPEDWLKPDLRALVHWEPKLRTDSLGKVSVTYYNADNIGKMLVVIEAISENGEIGYKEIEYKVVKKR